MSPKGADGSIPPGKQSEQHRQSSGARIVRHTGVSFTSGVNLVHFWIHGANEDLLQRRWANLLCSSGLAGELVLRHTDDGALHGCATVYIFLPLFLVRGVIEATWEPGDPRDAELGAEFELHSLDAHTYSRSYEWYCRIAQFRKWVAMPLLLGRQPALFLGTGRYSRLLTMNVDQSVSAPAALMGTDKAFCRSLLASQGFAVAPGAIASTPSQAVARARELGFPVALKRSQGSGNSEGVILGIETERDCIEAAVELLTAGQMLIVERMVPGIELRLHFIQGKLFRILRSEPLRVTGDGIKSVAGLLESEHPNYFRTMSGTAHHRHRLILQLHRLGVREFSDLERVVPRAGEVVRVSAAAGGAGMVKLEPDAINQADRLALEEFLGRHGTPSAGVDIILPRLGARLDEGGAIIEVNIPCGFGYLGDETPHAADLEVLGTARRCPGFIAAAGRVPLELAVRNEFPPGSKEHAALIDEFSKSSENPRIASLSLTHGWISILADTGATAFLVFVDEAAIEEHGMPANLQPVVRCSRPQPEFEACYPLLCATAMNAGGKFKGSGHDLQSLELEK
jgi:hypothetical protein